MLKLIRKARILARTIVGREVSGRVDVSLPTERFGSAYGGWNVVTDHLNADSIVYSIGIGRDVSFDTALIERFGLTVHGFDPTPKAIQWVRQQELRAEFVMHQYGVASFDGTVQFHGPPTADDISFSIFESHPGDTQAIEAPVKRLGTIIGELGHREIAILKMDIEGAEYEVIEDVLVSDIRPQLIIVEYHHRFSSIGMQKTCDSMNALRQSGYHLYWVSDSRMEFGFIHDELFRRRRAAA